MLVDANLKLLEDGCGRTVIDRSMTFDDEFMAGLRSDREAKRHMRAAEMDRVASVPAHVVDRWVRSGFDFWTARPRDIIARLQSEGLEAFITTPKRG